METQQTGPPFSGDGTLFRLAAEALRIRLAHLFDPILAVHTSLVEPLPHQITAVYEEMLPRQPLRFLLADDPGAGKTIMAGLLMKELMARGDLERCLVVCPGGLAEQWQDELYQRFRLPFEILTNNKLTAAEGNWLEEQHWVIARLDQLSRDAALLEQLASPSCQWDLVVCDEAHKMSASVFGNEVKYTKRYRLGELLSKQTRHFLLMTATPHNGKEEDFQLFMALLDPDRFEGRYRAGAHTADVSDLMRRVVKENLVRFDGTPLFPPRVAHTTPYQLSDAEMELYWQVTDYVRNEFNRAEALIDGRSSTIGFALTVLQRRLASSPAAIYNSLRRRRERRLADLQYLESCGQPWPMANLSAPPPLTTEEQEDAEEGLLGDLDAIETEILDGETTARSVEELRREVETLARLEELARQLYHRGTDTKWRELSELLNGLLTFNSFRTPIADATVPYGSDPILPPTASPAHKLIIFTEHRDTLHYLEERIGDILPPEKIATIHGGMSRSQRRQAQEEFRNDPNVKILLATDAAGEGFNLQRAHLMINYDLPWNPNRLEQRFGRIHRIGQTEVCHLWNLVAAGTREGDVLARLLEKLEQARRALGGQVFDVLGKVQYAGRPLRDLLIEAVRGSDQMVVTRLGPAVDEALNHETLRRLLEERALVKDVLDTSRIERIRADMQRAELRRLQPHYIESFFVKAFQSLGGSIRLREAERYEITHVPVAIRQHHPPGDRGHTIVARYHRVTFEKTRIEVSGMPTAEFLCPGHPLLDAVLDLILHRHQTVLQQGTILIDPKDKGATPRLLYTLEHAVAATDSTRHGQRRIISRELIYVELTAGNVVSYPKYAPYLDYRPLLPGEPPVADILAHPATATWLTPDLEQQALRLAISNIVPQHLAEVRNIRLRLISKTEAAVWDRLTKEISHWDRRAEELRLDELAGKQGTRLNSGQARARVEALRNRRLRRMAELKLQAQLEALPPKIYGGALIIPIGLLQIIKGAEPAARSAPADTQAAAARARAIVMAVERRLGYDPIDREFEKLGYDIESRNPQNGRLRFIEVKGRLSGAATVTVTRNEILYSLSNPEDFILAIVEFLPADDCRVHYLRQPFQTKPDFDATSINYDFAKLLARSEPPS